MERGPRKQHGLQSNEDFAKSWFQGLWNIENTSETRSVSVKAT